MSGWRDGREKPVRDRGSIRRGQAALIGIPLLATDASFHNKSPTPCLHCQPVSKLRGKRGELCVCVPYAASLSLCFSPTACISESIPDANGKRERGRESLHVWAKKIEEEEEKEERPARLLSVDTVNVSFSFDWLIVSILEIKRKKKHP